MIEQGFVTIPYEVNGEAIYGEPHELLVNAEIEALNAEGWRVLQTAAKRVGKPGTCLLVERVT